MFTESPNTEYSLCVSRPISPATTSPVWSPTRGDFEFGVARHLALKGKRQAVEVYELLRLQRVTGQPIERRATPLLGRATELRRLIMMWESAVGQAAWIEIRGETGL